MWMMVACLAAGNVWGQRGDRNGHMMEEVWKNFDVPAAPVLAPADALKSFRIAPGFRLELVASEPMIKNPVVIRWDGNGRLWVVEMTGYMPNADGKGENDLKNGRISVLEDTTGDGVMDKSTVFLDGLVMPRAFAFVQGGVLVAEPPKLFFCKDSNGDLRCDEKVEVLKYARVGPVEHTDNGLLPALDNWMYNAKSSRSFQFRDGKIVERKSKSRGQWGLTQDNYGRLFYNSNSHFLYGDWGIYQNLGGKVSYGTKAKGIHSIRVNTGINRGYQKAMLKKDGRLARITAVAGLGVYRGVTYPEAFRGGMFIPEPSANALTFHKVSDAPNSLRFEHQLYKDETFGQREFLASTDERFRPVDVEFGPDGCMYVVDLYHGILQHRVYVTTFLRKQIIERGLDKDNERGRIYRIVSEKAGRRSAIYTMESASAKDLVAKLADPNGWVRDTAQRLLVQKQDVSVASDLLALLSKSGADMHLARIHALWSLEGIGKADATALTKGFADAHPRVRLTALAVLAKESTAFKGNAELAAAVTTLAQDSDPEVKKLAAHIGKMMGGTLKVVVDPASKVKPLTGAAGKQYTAGKQTYSLLCGNCHQANGKGLEGLAPPLVGSEWVSGPVSRSIRISLSGVSGPIRVGKKTYTALPVMPGHGPLLDDEKIADVLTYVRHSWGNDFAPVNKQDVKRIRAATKSRTLPYTEAELRKVK